MDRVGTEASETQVRNHQPKGRIMKKLLWIFLAMLCALGLASCGGDDDDDDGGRAPQDISGPAVLRVVNQMQYVQEISFDGRYIGDVGVGASRDWSVPAGTHTVVAHDNVTGNATRTSTFVAGRTTVIYIQIVSRQADIDSAVFKTLEVAPE